MYSSLHSKQDVALPSDPMFCLDLNKRNLRQRTGF